jgi:hypothetical protein
MENTIMFELYSEYYYYCYEREYGIEVFDTRITVIIGPLVLCDVMFQEIDT